VSIKEFFYKTWNQGNRKNQQEINIAVKRAYDLGFVKKSHIHAYSRNTLGEYYDEKQIDFAIDFIEQEKQRSLSNTYSSTDDYMSEIDYKEPENGKLINENEKINMIRIKWFVLGLLILFLVLNPSPQSFEKHIDGVIGHKPSIAYRKANFLIFSIYYYREYKTDYSDVKRGTYLAILQNFIEL